MAVPDFVCGRGNGGGSGSCGCGGVFMNNMRKVGGPFESFFRECN